MGIALLTTFPKYDEVVYDLIRRKIWCCWSIKPAPWRNGSGRELPSTSGEAADEVFICSRPGPFGPDHSGCPLCRQEYEAGDRPGDHQH